MIIDVKGAKQSAPSDEPSRQKYLLKELKNSSAPFAIAAALASVALYLQSILPGMARAAPEAPTDPVTEPRAQQATGEATLQLVEPDPNRVQVDPDEEMDAPAKKAAVSKLLDGGGDRYELVDSPPMRLQSSHSPSVTSPTGEAGANDNSYPTPAHFESKQFGGQPAATRDGGGGEPQSRVRAEDEDVEEILNRAPRSTGHIVLPNVFGPAVITLSASDLLNGVEDPDGDVLEARNVTVNAGKLLKTDEGWTFEPAEPGPVTLRYEITDGRATIIQTAEFSAELPLPVFGGEGPDSISGTSWADTIDGLGGDDMIDGLAGDDILKGGDGDDHIVGGSGADLIFAGAGNDIVFGGRETIPSRAAMATTSSRATRETTRYSATPAMMKYPAAWATICCSAETATTWWTVAKATTRFTAMPATTTSPAAAAEISCKEATAMTLFQAAMAMI